MKSLCRIFSETSNESTAFFMFHLVQCEGGMPCGGRTSWHALCLRPATDRPFYPHFCPPLWSFWSHPSDFGRLAHHLVSVSHTPITQIRLWRRTTISNWHHAHDRSSRVKLLTSKPFKPSHRAQRAMAFYVEYLSPIQTQMCKCQICFRKSNDPKRLPMTTSHPNWFQNYHPDGPLGSFMIPVDCQRSQCNGS